MNSIEELYHFFQSNEYRYSTDSRSIQSGDLFFCLVGDKYDANVFAEEAANKGAKIVVTNRLDLQNRSGFYYCDDTLHCFQQLAKIHAEKMPARKIIIGGSNGKTTTKELVYCVLSIGGPTHMTSGNFNNHVGVPMTLLGIRPHHTYAVIEMGTNHPGEMATLCNLVTPDIGLITNIGKEHLEGFGDIESVAREESEVFQRLIEVNGIAIVNFDDPWISKMSARIKSKWGISLGNFQQLEKFNKEFEDIIHGEIVTEMPELSLNIRCEKNENFKRDAGFAIAGAYNAYNILFGVAVGEIFQIPFSDYMSAMQQYSPKNNRSEWRKIGKTQIFLDAYNANPSSMEVAIRSFNTLPGKKCFFLGDMLELGDHSVAEHQFLLHLLRELKIENNSYLVGNEFYTHCAEFPLRFTNVQSLLAWLDTHPVEADYIFIKGSRGIKMENVLEHFTS